MKTKQITVLLLAVLFPLLLNSCDDQSGHRAPGSTHKLTIFKSDGTDPKVIWQDGANNVNLVGDYTFLPNSNKILYSSQTGGATEENFGLYLMNPDGKGSYALLGNDHKINWFSSSPDNKKMLISASDGIYILDAGGEITLKKIQADLQDVRRASFSEDMTRIVFQQQYDIKLMDASGSNIRTIKTANDSTSYLFPGFVFHDSLIVYLERVKAGLSYIKSISLESGIEKNYYTIGLSETNPFYTFYDGKIIYQYGGPEGAIGEIDLVSYWLGARGIAAAGDISISNDRKKVIFRNGSSVFMVNIDGSDKKLLFSVDVSEHIGKPVLSPDGQYILCSGILYH
ncbi:MAG TPA: hypothetical protein VHO03_12080 [Ignavibacteriales bacterium]|nr:hypothetical protein [Ignavibacteriales bacterium]